MYYLFFIQLSVYGHLGYFHVLPIVNSAVSTWVRGRGGLSKDAFVDMLPPQECSSW